MIRHLTFLIILLFLLIVTGFGQESSADLKAKIKKLENEIAYTNKLIEQTRKSKQVTLNELKLINSQIGKRNELIATLKKEIFALDTKIESTQISIRRLNNELSDLKTEYSKIISSAYRLQSDYKKLMYVFSSEDMSQAYQRLRYLDQMAEYIRNEADTIRKKENKRELELSLYNQQVSEKKKLLDRENTQVSKLEREQTTKDDIKRRLTGAEKQLRADLRKKEKESKKLAKKIEEIIAKEIKREKEATKKGGYALSPEEKQLSSSFAVNRGKLPWPVERGMISETFGVHQHPVLRNVKTKNNGLNFATSENEEARTIFDGKIVSVTTLSSSNKAIIIKHGEYFTVYSNLAETYVKAGDNVSIKQLIGKVHTNLKGKTELHFQVWKGKELQNPAKWILKQ